MSSPSSNIAVSRKDGNGRFYEGFFILRHLTLFPQSLMPAWNTRRFFSHYFTSALTLDSRVAGWCLTSNTAPARKKKQPNKLWGALAGIFFFLFACSCLSLPMSCMDVCFVTSGSCIKWLPQMGS